MSVSCYRSRNGQRVDTTSPGVSNLEGARRDMKLCGGGGGWGGGGGGGGEGAGGLGGMGWRFGRVLVGVGVEI